MGLGLKILDNAIDVLQPVADFGNGFIADTYDMTSGGLGHVANLMDYVKSGDREHWRSMSKSFADAAAEREAMIKNKMIGKVGSTAGYVAGGAKGATYIAGKFGTKNTAKVLEKIYPNKGVENMRRAHRMSRKNHFDKNFVKPIGASVGVAIENIKDNIAAGGS